MNKPVYIGMSILDISRTLMYEFWYDYIKWKYGNRAKLCYTDTDSFIIHIWTEDLFEDIADDVKKRFDTSNYDKKDKRLLQIGVNKKFLGFFKDELGGKMRKEICALGPKLCAFSMDDGSQHKKAKGTKKPVNISKSDQCCFNVVDQHWNNIDPTLKMKQIPTSAFQRCKTLIQRGCPTLKQRWYNFILTLFQRVLNISKSYIKTSRASNK